METQAKPPFGKENQPIITKSDPDAGKDVKGRFFIHLQAEAYKGSVCRCNDGQEGSTPRS